MLGVRYDRYNPDADAGGAARLRRRARRPELLDAGGRGGGALAQGGRLTLEYDHNDNALGRTLTGLPTRLASDALTLRAQVVF